MKIIPRKSWSLADWHAHFRRWWRASTYVIGLCGGALIGLTIRQVWKGDMPILTAPFVGLLGMGWVLIKQHAWREMRKIERTIMYSDRGLMNRNVQ